MTTRVCKRRSLLVPAIPPRDSVGRTSVELPLVSSARMYLRSWVYNQCVYTNKTLDRVLTKWQKDMHKVGLMKDDVPFYYKPVS